MEIPFVLQMAIQERRTKGKYTKFHWRIKFRDFFKLQKGKIRYKTEVKRQCDKQYLKQMLKEINNG